MVFLPNNNSCYNRNLLYKALILYRDCNSKVITLKHYWPFKNEETVFPNQNTQSWGFRSKGTKYTIGVLYHCGDL